MKVDRLIKLICCSPLREETAVESKKEEERRTARSRKVEVDEGSKERSRNKHKVSEATVLKSCF